MIVARKFFPQQSLNPLHVVRRWFVLPVSNQRQHLTGRVLWREKTEEVVKFPAHCKSQHWQLPHATLISFSRTRSLYSFKLSLRRFAWYKISNFFSRISRNLLLHVIHSSDFKFLRGAGKKAENEKLITFGNDFARHGGLFRKRFLFIMAALKWQPIHLTESLCGDNERKHRYRSYNNFSLIQSHLMLVD